MFKDNRIGNFITMLSQRMNLNGRYKIGLKEISYTKSWYNVEREVGISLRTALNKEFNIETNKKGEVQRGNYSIKSLVEEINLRLSEFYTSTPAKVVFNENTRLLEIQPTTYENEKYYPYFEGDLGRMLGHNQENKIRDSINLKDDDIIAYVFFRERGENYFKSEITPEDKLKMMVHMQDGKPIVGSSPIDITGGHHSLFVYTDIIEPTHVGDSLVRLLQIVEIPPDSEFGDQIVVRFDKPDYRPLLKYDFDTIEIDIKDDAGVTVPFEFGRAIVTLHFIKVE